MSLFFFVPGARQVFLFGIIFSNDNFITLICEKKYVRYS
jgi:hypothetical protein